MSTRIQSIKTLSLATATVLTLALTGCQTMGMDGTADAPELASTLTSTDGNEVTVGQVVLRPVETGVQVYGEFMGLNPNSTYALHIHETGSCGNGGKYAGGHFNPTDKPHGHPDEEASHAGDLPNLETDAEGKAVINYINNDISTTPMQDDSVYNRSFVLHDGADDYVSQPSGNSGDRLACGIIVAS